MASYINKNNYQAMISALALFAKNTGETCEQLKSAAASCEQAIGSEDQAVAGISQSVQRGVQVYASLAKEALRIANLMKNELETLDREQRVWSSDD